MNSFFNNNTNKKLCINISPPDVEMSIIKRLKKPKFWISNNDFYELMGKLYKVTSSRALEQYYKQKHFFERKE